VFCVSFSLILHLQQKTVIDLSSLSDVIGELGMPSAHQQHKKPLNEKGKAKGLIGLHKHKAERVGGSASTRRSDALPEQQSKSKPGRAFGQAVGTLRLRKVIM
jgi:hypothetical protein